jgi:hypothetical protein
MGEEEEFFRLSAAQDTLCRDIGWKTRLVLAPMRRI